VYVIGGWVRDLFLKRESKDIDIVVAGSGIEMAEAMHEALGLKRKLQVFKNFGTAMLHYQDWQVEFVGARKESYRHGSRKPIVEDGSLEDDLKRRDFTINAMAISLNKEDFGTLIDPFGGQKDLVKKLVRTPLDPDVTYSDDPLRMMRAVRFQHSLTFRYTSLLLRPSAGTPAGLASFPWNGSWMSSTRSCLPISRAGDF
jgi:poly(A) polymerase